MKVVLSAETEEKRQELLSEKEKANKLAEKLADMIGQENVSLKIAECALSQARKLVRTHAMMSDQS